MARGRIELVNELKTVITGDVLRIRRMRTDTYEVPNGLNLLCFTNHENAVPIEQGDRRWLTLFSPAKAREPAYYGRLFDLLKSDDFAAAEKGKIGRALWRERVCQYVWLSVVAA